MKLFHTYLLKIPFQIVSVSVSHKGITKQEQFKIFREKSPNVLCDVATNVLDLEIITKLVKYRDGAGPLHQFI